MKFLRIIALIAPALISSLTAAPVGESRRFTRGITDNPQYQAGIIPSDQQRGVALMPEGNNQALYDGAPVAQLPWFCRIQRTTRHQISAVQGSSVTFGPVENPVAAFGGLSGGSSLYQDRDYRFGVFAGGRDYTNTSNPFRGIFRIRAYSVASLASGQNNVAHAHETTFEIPWPGDAQWDQFLQDGARKTVDFQGLKTTIQIVGGTELTEQTTEQWGAKNDPFLITHRASGTSFYYVVEYQGWTDVGSTVLPLVSSTAPPTITAGFCPLYALDFTTQPPWRSTFIDAPKYEGELVPSWYYGKSLAELQGAWGFAPSEPTVGMKDYKGAGYINHSPELRSHPELDNFITNMGSDPLTFINYVFNEIELTDPLSYNEDGGLDEAAIHCGGLNRGALATYLEGQGNPWEQCALLVYMLRKINVPAVYCEPEKDKLGMLDTQLNYLLRMRIKGAKQPDGSESLPQIVPVNYPWVSVWVESENRWVHIFPWLKDTEVIEGGNLYDHFPADCKTGKQWVKKYLQADPTVVPNQIAVYQQDSGADGIVSIEAEGYHETVAKGGRRWEPLADYDQGGGLSPTGYSGVSWMRVMPNGSADHASAGYSTTSPRLDYQINFTKTGVHYIWLRGQANNSSDNKVHIGFEGQETTTADNAGNFGTSFEWKDKDTGAVRLTINVASTGVKTLNAWMRNDGCRLDKILLTTNASYTPTDNGPAVSKQSDVEPNVPSNLFPRYARANLGANTAFDNLGVKIRDRRHYRSKYDEFPKPFQLQAGSHQFFEKLNDRPDTFDTVKVELWSDRDNDGIFSSNLGDACYFNSGEWLACDLHNRRFYAVFRPTTSAPYTHTVRLRMERFHSGITTYDQFTGNDPLAEQNASYFVGDLDNNFQFEITHRRQKKVSHFGIRKIDVIAQGSGFNTAPTVNIPAPPAGTNHRPAVAGPVQISGGKVISIPIIDPGFGYVTPPTITVSGGNGSGVQLKAILEGNTARWTHPLGIQVSQLNRNKPTIRKGDMAAICLNFGKVTDRMLKINAQKFWTFERDLKANPSNASQDFFREEAQAMSAHLMGMSYYNRVGNFKETNERLHKTRILSMYSAGLSKIEPYRYPSGSLPISGEVIPNQASVDMTFAAVAFASNASLHSESEVPLTESLEDFNQLLITEISAQEHAIINDYYKEQGGISTIKLLQRAKNLPAGIRRLTKANYVAEGNTNYTYVNQTKTLSAWDPGLWGQVTGFFTGEKGDYAEVFITPGPVVSASATYAGVGAMVYGTGNYAAFISSGMSVNNGGSGSFFSTPYYSPIQLGGVTLNSSKFGYSISSKPALSFSNPIIAPPLISSWQIPDTYNFLNTTSYIASPSQSSFWNSNSNLLTGSIGSLAGSFATTVDRGSIGSTSYHGPAQSSNSILSTIGGIIGDPVNVVTGEFYLDATDLTLPGPMPISIRRNYSSQSLSDNDFGHGWKLSYFPYLAVGTNDLIYAAEMDGSVVAYRKDAGNANLYVPQTVDNPSLKNVHAGGAGSTGNVMSNRLVKSIEGDDTIYTLSGPYGHTRRFKVEEFPIGSFTRSRPYLETWKDAHGNSLTFEFVNDSASPSYGLLKRIAANNGNFIGLEYDVYGHITEAWTGDGRRLYYTYDNQGDLKAVTLPDGAVHNYEYEQETITAGSESAQASKHLLIKEIKPNGRILVNEYDSQRRVSKQYAVVGETPNPVLNATFTYANSQNADKTWSGTTTVKDAYDRPTVFTYTQSLITGEDDPETPAETRLWYLPGDYSTGAFPRSLKQITDRRGVVAFYKYDTRGNLVEKSVGTDTSPVDIDGDGVASAGEKSVTSWTYTQTAPLDRIETETAPSGVVTKWFYDDGDYPYLATRVEKWTQGQLVSKLVHAFYEKTGSPSAYGLLQTERVAADSPDEALTTWEHDSRGFASRKTSATGTSDPPVVTDLVANLRGELVEETDSLNRKWKHAFDAMGRKIWSERRDATNTLISWDYTYYNLNGEVEWTDGPRYNPEDYAWRRYDGHGRATEEIRWRARANYEGTGVVAETGDALTSTTFHKYDLFNNLVETRTPRAHSVAMDYDQIGRLKQRDFYQGYKGLGGILKATESFLYEPGGEISSHTGVLGGVTTANYNARGQLRRRVNSDTSVEEWRYYNDGRLFKEILRNGSYWTTVYDDLNRVVTRTLKSAVNAVLKTQITKFDRRGNCIEETTDGNTFVQTYDDLNRVKSSTGPASTTNSAQQITTYVYPDGAGRETQVVNGNSEKSITLKDALGRVESVEVKNAANQTVRKTSYSYSADHYKTTVTEGTGPTAIVTRTWTDTFGKTVLNNKADDSAEWFFYYNDGSLSDHFDRLGRQTNYVLNWRGDVAQETRPGGVVVSYVTDAAGHILQRQMPGSLIEQAQYDSAGRLQWTKLTQGVGTTRLVNYAYHPSGHQWAGLLNTATDARGIVTTFNYDTALRVQSVTSDGPQVEDDVSRTLGYNERDMVTSIAESGLNGATQVTRLFDAYGSNYSETVSIGGNAHSTLIQNFDVAGRRSRVEGAGPRRDFLYRADGKLTDVCVIDKTYSTSFGDNGLLTGRSNPFRSVSVQSRDSLGRITGMQTTVAGTSVLNETIPQWNDLDKVSQMNVDRSGGGSWDEFRSVSYDYSGRLDYEQFNPIPGYGPEIIQSSFDNGAPTVTGGIGVRTKHLRYSDNNALQNVPSVSSFARVTSETLRNQPRAVALTGNAMGAGKVTLTVDGRDIQPVTYPGWQDNTGAWSASPLLTPGYHVFVATATHPSGWQAPQVSNFFQVVPHSATLTTTYDEVGNVATRAWTGGKSQALQWDARGRLVKVVETGSSAPFTWTALYDGLDRRIRTTYTPNGGSAVTANAVFDPQVEFLELGLSINGQNAWKIYGPDISGAYGGMQGLGGLEAVQGADGVTRAIINDWFGNVVGHVAAPNAAITWSHVQFLAWGPVPGWGTKPVDGTKPLHEILGYRGLTLDPPGYFHMGMRNYDPEVGRWLSPDPLGHSASLSLYDYCNNDPFNVADMDGRIGSFMYNGAGIGQGLRAAGSSIESFGVSTGVGWIAGTTGSLNGVLTTVGNIATAKTYVDTARHDFQNGGVAGVINRYNPVTMGISAVSGIDAAGSGRDLSWDQRLASGSGLVLGGRGVTSGSSALASRLSSIGEQMILREVSGGTLAPLANRVPAMTAEVANSAPAASSVAQTTILGENMAQRVIPFAEQTGARTIPFGATAEQWAAMTARQRWRLNDGALRLRINEGDIFRYIGQDPLRNPALRTQFDLTGSELLRLDSRGIIYETVSPSEVISVLGHQ